MLNRLTVAALLKAVILTTAFCIVIGFSLNAWDSWGRLQVTSRIAVIADASANLFKAMHNLRTDRSTTTRLLNSDQPVDGEVDKYLRGIRDAQMPAMSNALALLPSVEFPQQQTLVPELDRLFKTLTAEQKEFWEEISKPKASRRAALPKEYMETTGALLETLDKLSAALAAAVNHQDPVIDQLLAIKQIAWLLRNTAGEASLLVSQSITAGQLSPEAHLKYLKFVGGIDIAWNALQLTASGMALPPALAAAIEANKTAVQHGGALRWLVMQLALLIVARGLPFGAMMMVTRRVIKPLHNMRDAMLKVAAGDLTVDTGYTERRDEIGALAGALETFKQQATDKLRIEAQERERNTGAAARQRAIETYVGDFQSMVRQTLQQLGDASGQMRTTSSSLSAVSQKTNERG